MKNFVVLTLIILSTLTFSVSCTSSLTFDERFARNAKRMESDFINAEGIRCVDFSVEEKNINIKYVILNYSAEQLNQVKFAYAMKKYMVPKTCRDRDVRYLLENGVIFKYQYFTNDQIMLNETVMDKAFCEYQ